MTKNKDKMWSDTLKWEMYGKSNESVFVKGKLTLWACKIKLFVHVWSLGLYKFHLSKKYLYWPMILDRINVETKWGGCRKIGTILKWKIMEFLKGKNWWIEIRYPFHIARCAWACKWPTLITPTLSPLIKNIITFGPTAEAVVSFVVIFCKYNQNVKNTRHVNSVRCEFDSRKWIFYLRHE